MLPQVIQTHLSDIFDRINGLIFPTCNGYQNIIHFNLVEVQIRIKAYLNSAEFSQSVDLIKREGVEVKLIEITSDPAEQQDNTPKALALHCNEPSTLYFISAPGYFEFEYNSECDGFNLFAIENCVNEMKQHLDAYKALVEHRKTIAQKLAVINDFIQKSSLFMNPNPNITPLNIYQLAQLIHEFNQHWGELLPLKCSLKIKNGNAFALLSGSKILSTRDLPELSKFETGVRVQFDLHSLNDANNSTIYIESHSEPLVVPDKPLSLNKCGFFSAGAVMVATAAAMAIRMQM